MCFQRIPKEKAAKLDDVASWRLMYGLLYPAILGNALIFMGLRYLHFKGDFKQWISDPSIQTGFLFILFFCVAFSTSWKARRYDWGVFLVDFIEIVAMYYAFYRLGLIELPDSTITPVDLIKGIRWADGMLGCVIVIELLWRGLVGLGYESRGHEFTLRIIGIIAIAVDGFKCDTDNWHPVLTVVIALLVCFYIIPWFNEKEN